MSDHAESEGEYEEGEEYEEEEEEGEVEYIEEIVEYEEGEGEVTPAGDHPPRSRILRNPAVAEGELVTHIFEGVYTMTDSVELACEKFSDRVLYNWRPVAREHIIRTPSKNRDFVTVEYGEAETLTYGEFWQMVKSYASGLIRFDPSMVKGSFVGLYLNTQKEWPLSMHAAMLAGFTCVTVYANLGFDSLIKCLNETELSVLVCEGNNIQNIDENLHGACPHLQKLIVVGNITYRSKHFEMASLYDVMADGHAHVLEEFPNRPQPDDLAIIMYTSGTTGDPKGVMMRHRSLVSSCRGIADVVHIVETDVYLSYLPLAHVFELVCHNTMLTTGCLIGFGNPRTLAMKPGGALRLGDLMHVRPTVLIGVPKVYDTVAKGVRAKVHALGGLKEKLFKSVLAKKLAKIDAQGQRTVNVFGAKTIFKNVRAALGGRCRVVCSGGAPLAADSHKFLQGVLGKHSKVIQGYALTESCCGGFAQDPHSDVFRTLSVGQPFTCVEAMLESVPDMGYLTTNDPPKGEICLRGPCVSDGYYKKPAVTAESFAADGWFHTGDIGQINEDGSMSIIDRIKHLVKLSGGEYCALEHLEMLYGTSPFCAPTGICVIADSTKDHLVAIMCPDPVYSKQWASENGLGEVPLDELVRRPEFVGVVLRSFVDIHREDGRAGFELIKKVAIFNDEWTPENNMLTAANKLKRRCIAERYAETIAQLYASAPGEVRAAPTEGEEGPAVPPKFSLYKPPFAC